MGLTLASKRNSGAGRRAREQGLVNFGFGFFPDVGDGRLRQGDDEVEVRIIGVGLEHDLEPFELFRLVGGGFVLVRASGAVCALRNERDQQHGQEAQENKRIFLQIIRCHA